MKKIVTGTIAGAAGIALLLGGAGSFALWNAQASSAAAQISSGTLTMTADPDGTWTDMTETPNGPRNTPLSPATARMVPGNTYQFTQTMTVTAAGDDLKGVITYDPRSAVSGDADLLSQVQGAVTLSSDSASLVKSQTADNTYVLEPAAGTTTVKATYTVSLPESATSGQDGTISLAPMTFTLTQTPIGARS